MSGTLPGHIDKCKTLQRLGCGATASAHFVLAAFTGRQEVLEHCYANDHAVPGHGATLRKLITT